jgi:hypothetical protein
VARDAGGDQLELGEIKDDNENDVSAANPMQDTIIEELTPQMSPAKQPSEQKRNPLMDRAKRFERKELKEEKVMSRVFASHEAISENYDEERDNTHSKAPQSQISSNVTPVSRLTDKVSDVQNRAFRLSNRMEESGGAGDQDDVILESHQTSIDLPKTDAKNNNYFEPTFPSQSEKDKISDGGKNIEESGRSEWPILGALKSASSASIRKSAVHSDDEVTPRPDLDVGMSAGKLRLLQEEFDRFGPTEQPLAEGDDLELLSIDLNEKALVASIKASYAEKPLITPRLFGREKSRNSSEQRRADSDSACNLGSDDDNLVNDESGKRDRYGAKDDLDDDEQSIDLAKQSLLQLTK